MRTNIEIDDALMEQAMKAGPYKTKKDAVEAGLKLLARQAAYREILKWRGKLKWEGDEGVDWTQPDQATGDIAKDNARLVLAEPAPRLARRASTAPAAPSSRERTARRARR